MLLIGVSSVYCVIHNYSEFSVDWLSSVDVNWKKKVFVKKINLVCKYMYLLEADYYKEINKEKEEEGRKKWIKAKEIKTQIKCPF